MPATDITLTALGDLDITGGDISLLQGIDAVIQLLKTRLQTFLGEWEFDTTLGVPYFQDVLVKAPEQRALEAVFKDVILGTEGVLNLQKFDFTFSAAPRNLTVDFTVQTTQGVADVTI